MGIIWVDSTNYADDCVATLKKDGITVFRIFESRSGYYAEYYDTLFKTPHLSYEEAGKIAKEELDDDSIETRRAVAKEFFSEDYKQQIKMKIIQLKNMQI